MADPALLLDSNILIRWVQRTDADYTLVASALDSLSKRGTILCYTSQNLAEFWNACTRPADRNGFGLTPQETDRRARFKQSPGRTGPGPYMPPAFVHARIRQVSAVPSPV